MTNTRKITISSAFLAAALLSSPVAAQSGPCFNREEFIKLPASERRLIAEVAASNDEAVIFCSTNSSNFPKSSEADYPKEDARTTRSRRAASNHSPQDRFTPYVDRADFPDQASYDEYLSNPNARSVVVINGLRV